MEHVAGAEATHVLAGAKAEGTETQKQVVPVLSASTCGCGFVNA